MQKHEKKPHKPLAMPVGLAIMRPCRCGFAATLDKARLDIMLEKITNAVLFCIPSAIVGAYTYYLLING